VNCQIEVELKFLVPKNAREAIAAEMARGSSPQERRTLAASYFDTEDRRLARAGMAWRVRREGRLWIQTLKAGGGSALERFEHEVIRPDASHDPAAHAGTAAGKKLIKVLREAQKEGVEVGVRFQTEVVRTARRVRARGAVVEVAFDEGRVLSNESSLKIMELEFELISGSTTAMLGLVERWRKRFGLVYDPLSKSERGDRLAEGSSFPPLRKASLPDYQGDADATAAFCAVVDECLAHISRNSIGLVAGDPSLRVEHVHQVRVGIRRLRSALRSFEGWVPPPPDALTDGIRDLFATLGQARDSDVLDSGVVAELSKVGAPPLTMPVDPAGPDPAEAVRASKAQQLLLAWLAWRASLAERPAKVVGSASEEPRTGDGATVEQANEATAAGKEPPNPPPPQAGSQADGEEEPGSLEGSLVDHVVSVTAQGNGETGPIPESETPTFRLEAERRLRRWHRRIAADWKEFDSLDEESLHSLRKRIKRQRYAVEFFGPVLREQKTKRYLKPLTSIQDRMGELNDLFVAKARYQKLVESDPAAWFALGWLAARIADVRALAKPELKRLAKANPPVH